MQGKAGGRRRADARQGQSQSHALSGPLNVFLCLRILLRVCSKTGEMPD